MTSTKSKSALMNDYRPVGLNINCYWWITDSEISKYCYKMLKSFSCLMFDTMLVSSELGQFKLNIVFINCNTRIVYAKLITVGYAKSLLS